MQKWVKSFITTCDDKTKLGDELQIRAKSGTGEKIRHYKNIIQMMR